MRIIPTELEGVVILEPKIFGDPRGFFFEVWNRTRYKEQGLNWDFVQDNVSYSEHGVLRGLHYQYPMAQGKLVYVLTGEVLDIAVDIRVGSPTFGQHLSVRLSEENRRQLYIPPGYAHGFCVLSPSVLFTYKCTDYYNPSTEGGIQWDDPDLGIDWPVSDPTLSEKDRHTPPLREVDPSRLPQYKDFKQ